ncbi:MAG TPA: ABC transporter permease [Candidatus Deferrimicrobium sp.]|nr:ABC transporter permease [Candidatus Deferrimicrobium sp.]
MHSKSLIIYFISALIILPVYNTAWGNEAGPPATGLEKARLEKAISKAGDRLFALQSRDGSWTAPIRINPRETAYFIITARYLEITGLEDDIRQSARWLLAHVNDDHGWGFFDKGGKSDISITAIVVLALKLAGVPGQNPIMLKARDFLEMHGGIKATDIFCKTFYGLFNLYKEPWNDPRAAIFFPPLEILYLDVDDENSIYNNIAWGREAAIALSIIKEYKNRDNLFLKEKLIREAERWIVCHQLEDGCWYTLLGTCLNMIALDAIDREKHRPRVLHAMSWINNMRDPDGYQKRFQLSVWDTSFCIRGLLSAGVSPSHLSLLEAGQWLVNAQTMGGGKLWSNVPAGGWSYNRYNILYPDNDDTALALTALCGILFRSFSMEYCKSLAVERGIDWLLYMQNDDGGWGTFCRYKDEKEYTLPPDATQDPSVADITGHVLSALGARGYKSQHPAIEKAVQYLQRDQNQPGAWYGRWGLCYLYGTSCVLTGLKDVKFDMKEEFVLKAVRWLLNNRNPDGGWGEYFDYWDDRQGISYTKMGPSCPEQTAWALMALMAVDFQAYQAPIRDGIRYLLNTQENNGGWSNPRYTVLGLNPYRNTYYPVYFPLIALSDYARHLNMKPADENLSPETFRMIKDFLPAPDLDDFDLHYLTPPAVDISIAADREEKCRRLNILNTGKAPLEDLEIQIIDAGDNSLCAEMEFKNLKCDEPVSKKLILNPKGKEVLIKAAYKHRGTIHRQEKFFTLLPLPQPPVPVSLTGILVGLFLLCFGIGVFFLVRQTGKELVLYALRNLGRNKLRTGLSFMGIVIGIAATAGTISLGLSFENKLKEDFKSFGAGRIILLPRVLKIDIGPPQNNFKTLPPLKLTAAVAGELEKIENVKSVCPVIHYESTVTFAGEPADCFIQFVDPRSFQRITPLNLAAGSFLESNDLFSANIGHDIAAKAFSKEVNLNSILKIGDYKMKVKGIFADSQGLPGKIDSIVSPNIVVYLPLAAANRFLLKDSYDALELKVIDTDDIENTDKKINRVLSDMYPGYTFSTVYTAKLQNVVSGILDQFNTIISMIGIFCLAVSGVGIMNIMIVSVNERRSEIGILKALGATRRTVLKLFLTELTALGFLGALAGFFGGLAVIISVQAIARIHTPPNLLLLFADSVFLGEIVVLTFGIGPVLKELKKEPVDSIKERQ